MRPLLASAHYIERVASHVMRPRVVDVVMESAAPHRLQTDSAAVMSLSVQATATQPSSDEHSQGETEQIGALFIAALSQDTPPAWQRLLAQLSALDHSELDSLSRHPQTQHYIHRVLQHTVKHGTKSEGLDILPKIISLFPEAVAEYRSKVLPVSYSYSNLEDGSGTSRRGLRNARKRAATVDSASTDKRLFSYSGKQIPATFQGAPVKLKDLAPAVSSVAREVCIAEREGLSRRGITGMRLNRSATTPVLRSISHRDESDNVAKPYLTPVLGVETNDPHFQISTDATLFPQSHLRSPTKGKAVHFSPTGARSLPFKTAYQVIESFASGQLKSESESVYLNYTNADHWEPYNLTVVLKTRVNPEHFIISKFGILRVYSDGESELQSFADWLREASMYTMLRKIPFLRDYISKKVLRQWHSNVRFRNFARVHSQVSLRGVRYLPDFSDALFKVRNLCEELLTISFNQLRPLGGYAPGDYTHRLQGSQTKALRLLQRFFKYCQRIVAEVIEKTQSRALELETEKRHQPFVSDLPLSIQKERHMKLDRDLKAARYQESRLQDFITLVERVIISCLLKLARNESQTWIELTLKHTSPATTDEDGMIPDKASGVEEPSRPGTAETTVSQDSGRGLDNLPLSEPSSEGVAFLCLQMKFEGCLSTEPSLSELRSLVLGPLHRITELLVSVSRPLAAAAGVTRPHSEGAARPHTDSTRPSSEHSEQEAEVLSRAAMQPVTHRKSLLQALRGLSLAPLPSKTVADRMEEAGSLLSERVRSQLGAVRGEGVGVGGGGAAEGRSLLQADSLRARLETDEVLVLDCALLESAVGEVCGEVSAVCQQRDWLEEVWRFVQAWQWRSGGTAARDMTADHFEETLGRIYRWMELFSTLPSSHITAHQLASVGSGEAVRVWLPRLSAIMSHLKKTGVQHARDVCLRVLGETTLKAEALSSKRYDLEGFAEYARQLHASQTFHQAESGNISYVLRVHSILLRQGVEVTTGDKALGHQLQEIWREFEQRLSEAREFVDTQTPVKAQGLQESIQLCEDEIIALVRRANEGKFADPDGGHAPSELIQELKSIEETVLVVRSRLLGLSKWKEAITGRPYDLSNIASLMDELFMRQEVWKYRRIFDTYESEWSKTPFKKLDISAMELKLAEWQGAYPKMQGVLVSGDAVLESWRERLAAFKDGISLLKQLASKALRTSHWFTIFAALGEDYVPGHPYTLTDFNLYNIFKHSDIIFEICHDAMQEEQLRGQVSAMQHSLENMQLTISQMPLEHYPFAVPVDPPSSRKQTDKTTSFAIGFQQAASTEAARSFLYTVSNAEDVLVVLEDGIIQFKMFLVSPHLGGLKERVDGMLTSFRQLFELISLLVQTQSQWLEVLSLFSGVAASSSQTPSSALPYLHRATARLQEVVGSMRDDARLLSLLEKRRGRKGFRELQGETLRLSLSDISATLDAVVQEVSVCLQEVCSQCPRLSFLTDSEVLSVASHIGHPRAIMPLISRVLPGVVGVRVVEALASTSHSTNIAPDASEGVQLLGVEGLLGEWLPLATPLPLGPAPAHLWLSALQAALSHTLACLLTESMTTFPDALTGVRTEDTTAGSPPCSSVLLQWVCGQPAQCVLLALEVNCGEAVTTALSSEDPRLQLREASARINTAIDLTSEALRTTTSFAAGSTGNTAGGQQLTAAVVQGTGSLFGKQSRLQQTLQNVIIALKHWSEVAGSLLKCEALSLDSFEWSNHIYYSADVAHTETEEPMETRHSLQSSQSSLLLTSRSSLIDPQRLGSSHRLLKGSTPSLVASSKSLLSSRNTLITNELQRTGAASRDEIPRSTRTPHALPTRCTVHCCDTAALYGYEYRGAESRLVLTPPTESCLVSLVQSIAGFSSFAELSGAACAGKSDTHREVAKILGRHSYEFTCTPLTTLPTLTRLVGGALQAGSLLSLERYSALAPRVCVGLGLLLEQLLSTLSKAFSESHDMSAWQSEVPTSRTVSPLHPLTHHTSTPSHPHRPHTVTTRPTSTRIDWYNMAGVFSNGAELAHATLEFSGRTLNACRHFACVLVDSECGREVPQQLKNCTRPCSLVSPDPLLLAEVLLLSQAFSEARSLARPLTSLLQHCRHQLSASMCFFARGAATNLRLLKEIVSQASANLSSCPRDSYQQDRLRSEQEALVTALSNVCLLQLSKADASKFRELLANCFPGVEVAGRLEGEGEELMEAIQSQLKERHLQCEPAFVEKITQLHASLQSHSCVVLCGPSGCGKSSTYQLLAEAYRHIRELQALGKKSRGGGSGGSGGHSFPRVELTVLKPGAYTSEELFGGYSIRGGGGRRGGLCADEQWRDGILSRLLRQFQTSHSLRSRQPANTEDSTITTTGAAAAVLDPVAHWLVLDGPPPPYLVDSLAALLGGGGLPLANGEMIALPPSCHLLLETPTLTNLTPSLLSQASLLHYNVEVLSFEAMVDTWLDRAPIQHNLSTASAESLGQMIRLLLPDTLSFLEETNARLHSSLHRAWQQGAQVPGAAQTRCLLNLLSAVLERNCPKLESSVAYTGLASRSSRLSSRVSSSRLSEAHASSSVLHEYSMASMAAESVLALHKPAVSRVEVGSDLADPLNDDVMSECSNLEAEIALTVQLQLASMLAFAYIWSLGAFVPFSEVSSFSEFAREQISLLPFSVPLPEDGCVFDYYLDLRRYQFLPWSERKAEGGGATTSGGFVSSPELDRYSYLIDLYLSYGLNVMLLGAEGSGKTSFVERVVQPRLPLATLPITHTLTPSLLQQEILERVAQLEKRAGQRMGTSKRQTSQKCVFFLDDLHLASSSHSGAPLTDTSVETNLAQDYTNSPLLELLRGAIDQDSLPDFTRNYQHDLHNVHFISSCVPGGYWRLPLQFSRSFNPLPFLPPSDEHLQRVCSQNVLLWLQQFPTTAIGDPEPLAQAVAIASVTVFRSVSAKFSPSPSRPHLLFTLHDLLHVCEGLLLMSATSNATSQPHFSLLNRRGFLSSNQSGGHKGSSSSSSSSSIKKTKSGVKSGRRHTLPGIRDKSGEASAIKSKMRARLQSQTTTAAVSETDQAQLASTLRMVVRVWCHECTRVFVDRLVESRDRMWFVKLLEVCVKFCFCGVGFGEGGGNVPPQPLTTAQSMRRVRGGRGRVPPTSSVEGLNAAELAASGVSVATLLSLGGGEGGREAMAKLVPLEQVILRGEDLTGLMFAQFPVPQLPPSRPTSKEEGEEGEGGDSSGNDSSHSDESSSEHVRSPDAAAPPSASRKITPLPQESGVYSELGDGQVMEVLVKHLAALKPVVSDDVTAAGLTQLVLYRGAIEHATRIGRVLALPGCHALLLGARGTGRRSLLRLMAHINSAQMCDLSEGWLEHKALRSQLREVCISAAVEEQATVLLVAGASFSTPGWNDVCSIMSHGLCAGLFSSSELLVMSSRLQRNKVGKKTTDGARQSIARAVLRNLHVVIVWDVDAKTGAVFHTNVESGTTKEMDREERTLPEASARAIFVRLSRVCSYVDHYQPWSKHAYADIAMRCWQKQDGPAWQGWVETSSQLEAVGNLAAHVHLTTEEMLGRVVRGEGACEAGRVVRGEEEGCEAGRMVSPKSFVECLKMTQKIASKLKNEEKIVLERLETAVQRLEEVDRTVYQLGEQLATLQPQLRAAEQEVQYKMGLITAAKERYMAANQRCKLAEETIATETRNVKELSKTVEDKFNESSPVYHSALEALSAVKKNDVLEFMSYRDPPELLMPVFQALCMLFDRQQTWDDCKQLLLSHNFFESLKFFDRDHVPRSKLSKLKKMIVHSSKFEALEQGSKAVVPLCMWLTALVDYHQAKMSVQPFRKKLAEAERTLMDANKTFVEMRKDMLETKSALESTVKLHKESVQKARGTEIEIEGIQKQLDSARHLLTTMSTQRRKWDAKLKETHSRIASVPGHALLCAASTCYLPRVPPDSHSELLNNWLGYCAGAVSLGSLTDYSSLQGGLKSAQGQHGFASQQTVVVRIQSDFSISGSLSEKDERSFWKEESVFPDDVTLERCLQCRAACRYGSESWPLVFDQHNLFLDLLCAMEHNACSSHGNGGNSALKSADRHSALQRKPSSSKLVQTFVTLKLTEPDMVIELREAVLTGRTVALILDTQNLPRIESDELKFIEKVIQRDFTLNPSTGRTELHTDTSSTQVHENFSLYLVIPEQTPTTFLQEDSSLIRDLASHCVVELSLSGAGLEKHFQRLVIGKERPEFSIRYKSLLTDMTLHHQQIASSQERILGTTVDTSSLHPPSLTTPSLLHSPCLLSTLAECESSEISALDLIRETHKSLRHYEQQARAYSPLAEYTRIVFSSVQRLANSLKYFTLSLAQFEHLLINLIASSRVNKIPDSSSSIKAHVLHLKHQLLISVCQALQLQTFSKHRILLPFLVGLELQLSLGKLTPAELRALGSDLASTKAQLDLLLDAGETGGASQPGWISNKEWCGVMSLQKLLPSLRRLAVELTTNSSEWSEYFNLDLHLLSAVPGYGDALSLGVRLVLWSLFKPAKFHDAVTEFVLLTVGSEFTTATDQQPLMELVLPSTVSQSPTVFMSQPSEHSRASKQITDSLQDSARVRGVELWSFAVPDAVRFEQLSERLAGELLGERYWVLLEHCHLCEHWSSRLEALCQLIRSSPGLNPDFRVWLILPVAACSSLPPTGYTKVALSSSSEPHSAELLGSVSRLVSGRHSVSTTVGLDGCQALVSKLGAFVPLPLSDTEISELDPSQYNQDASTQSLVALIFEELCTHNSALVQLHASLRLAENYLKGEIHFTPKIGQILSELSANKLPKSWAANLPQPLCVCVELVPVLKLLKSRVAFYTATLQSGSLPSELQPLFFSRPSELLSRSAVGFASECQLPLASITLEGTLFRQSPSSGQRPQSSYGLSPSLVFPSLSLHGAAWSEEEASLTLLPSPLPPHHSTLYCASVRPCECEGGAGGWFQCPVLLAVGQSSVTECDSGEKIVLFHVPLLLSGGSPVIGSNVHLQCILPQ